MYKYEDLRDELKKYKYIVYLVENNKYQIALRFKGTKSELVNKLEKKYKKKSPDIYFIWYKFGFHTGTKPFQGGPLSITFNTLIFVENQLKSGYIYGKKYDNINGKVWFQKSFLEKNGWSEKYLDNMTSKLDKGSVKLSQLTVNMYNVKF